jgi:hypothetical protein
MAKKQRRDREPLLNAVARKLGHAAGSLSKVTQQFTEALSTTPDAVIAKMRETALFGAPTGPADSPPHGKQIPTATRKNKLKKTSATAKNRKRTARPSSSLPRLRKNKKTK